MISVLFRKSIRPYQKPYRGLIVQGPEQSISVNVVLMAFIYYPKYSDLVLKNLKIYSAKRQLKIS